MKVLLAGLGIGILAVVVWALMRFVGRRGRDHQVSAALRELLLARASGGLSEEEFNRRQAALHAELLTTEAPTAQTGNWWMLIPVALLAAILGFLMVPGKKPAAPSTGLPLSLDAKTPAGAGTAMPMGEMPAGQGAPNNNSGGDLKVMVKRLADKLAKSPDNGEGWLLLARTYIELAQPKQADEAFAKAAKLVKPDANLMADWADAHVVASGRKWDDQARQLVRDALKAEPKHMKALGLAGSEAFERGDYKNAIVYWKKMREVAPPDSMDARLADSNIHEAEAALSGKKPASP